MTDRAHPWTFGDAVPGGHVFEQEIVDRTPVLACVACDLIWWPDQRFPKQTCRQRQAANARRR